MRERFLSAENEARNETDLLELLLTFTIPLKDVRPLAERLLDEFGGLSALLASSPAAMREVKGVGEVTAVLLKVADWLRIHYAAAEEEPRSKPLQPHVQRLLFDDSVPPESPPETAADAQEEQTEKTSPPEKAEKKRSGLFGKAALKEAIELLPALPDTDSIEEIRSFFRSNLHYNAETTRRRYANYIVRRMFPQAKPEAALRKFAKKFGGDRNLGEVCFYRFIKVEPLTIEVAHELLIPEIGVGKLNRKRLAEYLQGRFPGYKSIGDCARSLIEAFSAGGVVKADRNKLTFSYRDIPLAAFAFVLHEEFPEPGMYDLAAAEQNEVFKAMLWDPDLILPSIYELRNQGLISKVSEIDSVRQFTTRFALSGVVEKICENGDDK